jgi:hypothetical protein
VEEARIMTKKREDLVGKSANDAAAFAMDNDLGDLLDEAEVARERGPAKIVTALRIDLDIQSELEAAAAARGIGSSTLMRQIIEERVSAHRDAPAPDQLVELVRHLDAARNVPHRSHRTRPSNQGPHLDLFRPVWFPTRRAD